MNLSTISDAIVFSTHLQHVHVSGAQATQLTESGKATTMNHGLVRDLNV